MPLRELSALESSDETLELLQPVELPKGVFLVPDKIIRNTAPALMRNMSKAWEEFNKQIQRYEQVVATELNRLRQERMTPNTAVRQKADSLSVKLSSLNKKMQEKVDGQIGSDDNSSSDDTNAIEKSLREQDASSNTSHPDERSRSDNYKDFWKMILILLLFQNLIRTLQIKLQYRLSSCLSHSRQPLLPLKT